MCSWHAPRAVLTYLSEYNQWIRQGKHTELNYNDPNRERGWDIAFEDSPEWVAARNMVLENEIVSKINSQYKHLEEEAFRKKIQESIAKKQLCVGDKDIRKAIVEVYETHLRWHPLTHMDEGTWDYTQEGVREIWADQTRELFDVCRLSGQSWAWEYLWKNWYRPDRWTTWARAVSPDVSTFRTILTCFRSP